MKQKHRLLKHGWDYAGTARELNRVADQWVFRGSPHDKPRVMKEVVAHESTKAVLSLTRYDILMKTSTRMMPVKIKQLALRFEDPVTRRPLEIDWNESRTWSLAILGSESGLAIYRDTKDELGNHVQQWSLFCSEKWEPREPPLGIELENGVRWDQYEQGEEWRKTQ